MIIGIVWYGNLADGTLFEGRGRVHSQSFGPVDALIAGGLSALFGAIILTGFSANAHHPPEKLPDGTAMILGVVLSTMIFTVIVVGIIGGLLARNIPWWDAFGVSRAGFVEVVWKASLLLLLAYPLIFGTLALTRLLLSAGGYGDDAPQEIVRFLARPGTGAARIIVAFSAMVFAPVQEEFIFRGYIYGVARRYLGPGAGIVISAALFAGIHLHAPSFGGLFVLAVCLALAYEWTGSIFVPITMHALFNSLSVVSLFHGGGDF